MLYTRLNSRKKRRASSRRNRKTMKGAGFFDFLMPSAAAPVAGNAAAPANAAVAAPAAPSLMNRIRGARNTALGSLRAARNTVGAKVGIVSNTNTTRNQKNIL
jgi:hypothetical protein